MPRSYCTRDDSPMLGASLQLMSEPGSSSCREGWTMGRTKASSGLSTEEYGLILRHFEEHGPQKVEEEMRIPHKEDKLPQEPVLCGQPEPQSSVLYPWLPCSLCPNRAHPHACAAHPQRLYCAISCSTLCAHSCACFYDTALSNIFPISLR